MSDWPGNGPAPSGASVGIPASRRHGWRLNLDRPAPDTLRIRLGGTWTLRDGVPAPDDLERALAGAAGTRRVVLEARDVGAWDTALVAFVMKVVRWAEGASLRVDREGFPPGVDRLIALASAVPEERTGRTTVPASWLARVGLTFLALWTAALAWIRFVGDATLAFVRLVRGQATFRRADFFGVIHECGPRALPIVTLISALVGLILAFMGAVQLRSFGAQVYVADLVAIAATREMGCLMTGVIMAGRTGAAFAAQLGTMRVNEEIDALVTMGIPPMDFLVLPRMLALVLMMPILTVYADLLAILGGGVVGVTVLGLGLVEYVDRTLHALSLTNVFLGIFKGSVFGVLVAVAGCLRGIQSGRSAAAVGLAATSAVVTAIVLIVVAEGLFAVVLDALRF
jgi:phospholipid/cholesterol/gamma-HCH transport system permease protein